MIGGDGIKRLEVLLGREEREALDLMIYKYKSKSRAAAIRMCIRMVHKWLALPVNPEHQD